MKETTLKYYQGINHFIINEKLLDKKNFLEMIDTFHVTVERTTSVNKGSFLFPNYVEETYKEIEKYYVFTFKEYYIKEFLRDKISFFNINELLHKKILKSDNVVKYGFLKNVEIVVGIMHVKDWRRMTASVYNFDSSLKQEHYERYYKKVFDKCLKQMYYNSLFNSNKLEKYKKDEFDDSEVEEEPVSIYNQFVEERRFFQF